MFDSSNTFRHSIYKYSIKGWENMWEGITNCLILGYFYMISIIDSFEKKDYKNFLGVILLIARVRILEVIYCIQFLVLFVSLHMIYVYGLMEFLIYIYIYIYVKVWKGII